MCQMLHILASMLFFGEVLGFLHLSWIGLFGSKRAYIHFKTSKLQGVLWPKLPIFSQENNGYLLLHLTETIVFSRHMCFFNVAEQASWEKSEPLFTMKLLFCRKYSFQTLLQFSLGNNWIDAPVSRSHGFLLEDTCASSNQLNWPIWCNQRRYPDWIT
jgi:hypothetical protein